MDISMGYDQKAENWEVDIQESMQKCQSVLTEVSKCIVGQDLIMKRLVAALIAQGHVLIEGMPGLAKTTAIKTLSEATGLQFKRIQFTPDLLPADLIGTQIYDPQRGEFKVKKGPVFAHLVLADEINRAPAKVQSALLEAMEERQVTVGDETFLLEEPFLVMATQNPVEQEGTYPLPEAQIDRFLMKLLISYGSEADEQEIMARSFESSTSEINKCLTRNDICQMGRLLGRIFVAEKVRKYIVQLVFATRKPKDYGLKDLQTMIDYGASPRASLALERVARVNALMEGRTYVTPQDIKDIAFEVLRHRIKLTYEAEAEHIVSDDIIKKILDRVDVP